MINKTARLLSKISRASALGSLCLLLILIFFPLACSKESSKNEAFSQTEEAAAPKSPAKPVFSMGENQFTTEDFDRFVQFKYADISRNPETTARLMSRIFDAFVEHSMVLTSARQDGFSISKADTAAYLTDLRIDTGHLDEQALGEEALIQRYLLTRVYNQIDVDIKECQAFYNQNKQQYVKNKQIMLYQILLKDQKRAFEIKQILENEPKRFEEFARSDSHSPEAKKDGLMGFFELGQLPEEIEKYVFALKQNDISQVIQSPYGFHIFRVTQILDGKKTYFDQVKDEIKNNLLSTKLRMAYDAYLGDLKKNNPITLYTENLPFKYESNEYGGNNEPEK